MTLACHHTLTAAIHHGSLANALQSSREDDADVFLGEANALGYIRHGSGDSSIIQAVAAPSLNTKFRYALPSGVKADALVPPWEAERRKKRIEYLSKPLRRDIQHTIELIFCR